MASPLLETKLFVPRGRGDRVPRPRLAERLDRGAAGKLTLVSAPAGFGKTTLLAEWLAAPAGGRTAAWVSLDEGDNHPAAFWRYVVAALHRGWPAVGAEALARLEEPQPAVEAILAGLLNELATLAGDVVLVLDDYHLIDAREVHDGLAFLLERMPPTLHLLIASRADPALPLPRLRARGDLVEIRAADLRFTPDEAAAYLNEAMGLGLTPEDVAALEARTEGWIAALQLAALSVRDRADAASFIAGFAGDDRYVVDYLVEEVLQRQPERIRRFLLETAVLDRMTGSLCDAVTSLDGGRATLEALERGNLFLVALDDRRRWYRYHHLFADVLRAHLAEAEPDLVSELHRRASAWHAQHGEPADAVRHALAAGDFGGAAGLVELAAPALLRSRQEATALGWLRALPDEVLRCRPVLSDLYAGVLLQTGQMDGVEERLRDAERWEDAAGTHPSPAALPDGMIVASDEGLRRLQGSVAMHRAGQALILGEVDQTVVHAQRALERSAEDDHLVRGGAAALLGLAAWRRGDLDAAHANYAESMARLRRAGHVADTFGCALVLADVRITQGRLREAMRTYERTLELAAEHGGPALRGAADMHVGMAALHRERGDLDAAAQHLSRSEELGEHAGLPQNRYRWRLVMACVRQAQGDLDGALMMLDEAERLYDGDFFPNVRPIAAWRARVWAAQGRLGEALGWARERGLAADDDLSYLREFEHVTLARVLLARFRAERSAPVLDDASRLLERLDRAADDGGRMGTVVEVLVLKALAAEMRGDPRSASASLARALALAEPEGYVRVFADEGAHIAPLLSEAAKRGAAPAYARRLLAAFGAGENRAAPKQDLVEPLSERELDVLRLLGSHLNGPDIASELVVSVNTLRTHTKNIFSKLGVNNRRDAVLRAAQLGLVRETRHQPGAPSLPGV